MSVRKSSLFETPSKTEGVADQILTPAFSTSKEMSTQQSTGNGKADALEQTFSKLSALVTSKSDMNANYPQCSASRSASPAKEDDNSLINGDLNYLLDREIQKVAVVPRAVLVRGHCNSTNHSSTSKSPLAAYDTTHQSCDFLAGPVFTSKQGSTISQRSSFDDSILFTNDICLGRAEVSPGKMGDGLFSAQAKVQMQARNDSEEELSSEEESLIAQSTFEIKSIFKDKARPSFLSRLHALGEEAALSESEGNDVDRSVDEGFLSRRLRVFQDITKRSVGKSNETPKVTQM